MCSMCKATDLKGPYTKKSECEDAQIITLHAKALSPDRFDTAQLEIIFVAVKTDWSKRRNRNLHNEMILYQLLPHESFAPKGFNLAQVDSTFFVVSRKHLKQFHIFAHTQSRTFHACFWVCISILISYVVKISVMLDTLELIFISSSTK